MWAWTYNPMPEIHWLNNPFRHKGFPGSPLFCKFNEHDGLVGILLSNDIGGNKGDKSKFSKKKNEFEHQISFSQYPERILNKSVPLQN